MAGARQDHTPVTDAQREEFLDTLAAGHSIVTAAGNESLRRKLYRLKESDATFAAEWKRAYKEGTDVLVGEAIRRAVEGVNEPKMIGHGENAEVITVKKYSDVLLMFLIKQRDPTYRERVAIGGDEDAPPVRMEVELGDSTRDVLAGLVEAGVIQPGPSAAPDAEG